jgi:hypothetical protein
VLLLPLQRLPQRGCAALQPGHLLHVAGGARQGVDLAPQLLQAHVQLPLVQSPSPW